MPPKAKITKEMVIDAAFDIARTEGAEQINARTVSQKLGCSTQPVMYHFSKIEDIKQATYEKTDRFHSEYLMNVVEQSEDFILGIGLNYIRFAIEEPHLFRFLFQSGYAVENNLLEMIDSKELKPILVAMREVSGMNEKQMKEVFITIALFAHGYASFFANNSLEYDETVVSKHLERAYRGAVLALQEDDK
ncbi:MAG: TetR/AcrR family transcriptional regulator [Oscillospiraceae bacterium]